MKKFSKVNSCATFSVVWSRESREQPKICIKNSKHGSVSFSSTIDCSCLVYFDLKKYQFDNLVSFILSNFLVWTLSFTKTLFQKKVCPWKTQIAFSMFPLGTNLWEQPLWYVNCLEHAKLDIIDTVKRNVNQGLLK